MDLLEVCEVSIFRDLLRYHYDLLVHSSLLISYNSSNSGSERQQDAMLEVFVQLNPSGRLRYVGPTYAGQLDHVAECVH